MKSIFTEFEKSGLIFDKTTQSLSALPYEYDDIKIKVNEFVTSSVYNKAILKMYYNLLYIYRACNVADFNLFNTYNYSLSTEENNQLRFYIEQKQFFETKSNILSGTFEAVLINTDFSNNELNFLLAIDSTRVSVISLQKDGVCNLAFTNTLVGGVSSDIRYADLIDIKSSGDNHVYLVDGGYNNIYHYDVINLITFIIFN